MLDSLFENVNVLQTSLHGLSARTRAVGENIANADTPGYKRMEVQYEQALRKAVKARKAAGEDLGLKTDSDRHFHLGPNASVQQAPVTMVQVRDESYRNDGNNVDIELEMTKLAETNMRYNTVAKLTRDKFEGLKTILREIR